MQILDRQENYLLVTDGAQHYTVVEGRNGKFYGLRTCGRRGVSPDDRGIAELMRETGSFTEPEARHLLAKISSEWRDLFELVR